MIKTSSTAIAIFIFGYSANILPMYAMRTAKPTISHAYQARSTNNYSSNRPTRTRPSITPENQPKQERILNFNTNHPCVKKMNEMQLGTIPNKVENNIKRHPVLASAFAAAAYHTLICTASGADIFSIDTAMLSVGGIGYIVALIGEAEHKRDNMPIKK